MRALREDLKKKGGEREILEVLDRACMKDKRVMKIRNIENYYKVHRKEEETVKECVERYEHVAWNCREERGGELPEEMRDWHLLGQAGLDDN